VASSGGYTACLSNTAFTGPANGTATVLYDGAQQTLSKGRLNLFTPQAFLVNSHHFITLLDSQPALTQSTIGYRPLASANDVYIGTDMGTKKRWKHLHFGGWLPLSQMKIYSIKNLPASHVPPQRCIDVDGEARGLTKSDQITSITPPGRLGNLSLSAYASGEGTIILHFCNPSSSEGTTPLGAYSFLAVH
jgi:hypothetical protein